MARVHYQEGNVTKSMEVPDGAPIAEACESMGVLFACGGNGRCGTCLCRVTSGHQHLSPPTEAEVDFLGPQGVKHERMACQAHIISGDVTLTR